MAIQAIIQQPPSVQNTVNMFTFVSMDFQQQKAELAKAILETKDQALILRLKEFIEAYRNDFWHTLPDHVKDGVKAAQLEIEQGKFISLEDFKKEIDNL